MHCITPHWPQLSQTVPMFPQHSLPPQTLLPSMQQLAPVALPVQMGPSPGCWPPVAASDHGVHVGFGGHEHAPQLQSDPHVCVPYVLHACVDPMVHPVCPLHAPGDPH
jgi:hypothetical protein